MSFQIQKPSASLQSFVKHYWVIENLVDPANAYQQRIVPSGLFELTFYLGQRPKLIGNGSALTSNTLISGQLTNYYDLEVSQNLNLFSVTLYPFGAMLFFNIPASALLNQNVPLEFLMKKERNELDEKLLEANSFKAKVDLMENFFQHQLKKRFVVKNLDRILSSIKLLEQKSGNVDIETLASHACLSRKQYERIFFENIGATPKQFLKIIRFQSSVFARQKNEEQSLTGLAHQCGYYDQSHMINDFKSLSGHTPKKFFDDCEPFSDYFS